MTVDLNLIGPNEPRMHDELYSIYEQLREQAPVYFAPNINGYMVTRHDDIMTVLMDPKTFSNVHAHDSPQVENPVLAAADDPEHDVQRRLIFRAFSPKAIRELKDFVQQVADDLIDNFVDKKSCDLVEEFAHPFPMILLGHLFGVSPDDADFRGWTDDMFAAAISNPDDAVLERAMGAFMEFGEYIVKKAAERRELIAKGEEVPDDVLTVLVTPNDDGEVLPEEDFVAASAQLLTAGHETTTKLIGNTIYLLMKHPDQLQLLNENPDLIGAVIEESLRFESPAQGLWRRVTVDTELARAKIPADSRVYMVFGSANRDPSIYHEPDKFNILRDTAELRQHQAFGHGIHSCMGMHLARLEGVIAIQSLLKSLPNLRLDDNAEALRSPLYFMRGWSTLPICWD